MKHLILLLGGLALLCCREPSAPDACNTTPSFDVENCGSPRIADGCQTTVTVRVTEDSIPRIDWSPPCGMNHVVVRAARSDGLGGQVFWAFSTDGLVGPGVRYGIFPPGTISEGPTRVLQAGTAYRVFLEMIVDGNRVTGQGDATFVPQ